MKVPTYQEITDFSGDKKSLKASLTKAGAGHNPLYFDCEAMTATQINEFSQALFETLQEIYINPLFPYPIYLLNSKVTGTEHFLCIKSEEDLPSFFMQKQSRLKNKEQAILTKVQITSEKTRNINITEKVNFVRQRSKKQKEIFKLEKELKFLENVREKLARSIREEE